MVDISSGDKKINITVSTSGNKASVNATPDMAMYYSNKSREWAISNKIVDNEDYSSKYYAQKSKEQAQISTDKATEVVNSGNEALSNIDNAKTNALTDIGNLQNESIENITNLKNTSLSDIETSKTNAISDITNQENLSVDNVNTAGATQVNLAKEQATIATTQAEIATAKTSEVVESGDNAITAITEQETTSKNNIETKGAEQIELIQNEGTTQIANIQATGQTEYNKIITTGIDNKANVDADNFSSLGKAEITSWGVPDYINGVQGVAAGNTWKLADRDILLSVWVKNANDLYGFTIQLKDEEGNYVPSPVTVPYEGAVLNYSASGPRGLGHYMNMLLIIPKGYSYLVGIYVGNVYFGECFEYPLKGVSE